MEITGGSVPGANCAVGAHARQHPAQPLQQDLVDETAAVEALIDDQSLLVDLWIELVDELLHAVGAHVVQVDVADLAIRGFGHVVRGCA